MSSNVKYYNSAILKNHYHITKYIGCLNMMFYQMIIHWMETLLENILEKTWIIKILFVYLFIKCIYTKNNIMNLEQVAIAYGINPNNLNAKDDGLKIAVKSIKDLVRQMEQRNVDTQTISQVKRLGEFLFAVSDSQMG